MTTPRPPRQMDGATRTGQRICKSCGQVVKDHPSLSERILRFLQAPNLFTPATYRTKTGRLLTEADIEVLVEEAERGYDVEHLKGKDQ